MALQFEGLPEGVEAVRYGLPEAREFYLNGGHIYTDGTYAALIVAPACGYSFVYDIATDSYVVIKQFQTPKRLSVEFVVASSRDESAVRNAVQKLPGFAGIAEQSA